MDQRHGIRPTREDVLAAHARLSGKVRRTPVIEVDPEDLGAGSGFQLFLKLELLQQTGSFKARGARHAVAVLPDGVPGVVAASGGNHGAAVSWAATDAGLPATIFVPAFSSEVKRRRIASFGGGVEVVDGPYDEVLAAASTFAAAEGCRNIHAFDDHDAIAGAGTLGLELVEQVPEVDQVLVAVGGGGLYAGVRIACGQEIDVVPVEPVQSNALAAALRAGERVPVEVSGVAADSTGATRPGLVGFSVATEAGVDCHEVTDAAIMAARERLWQACRVVAEPGGAVALASLTSGVVTPRPGSTVVVVVCGGNTASLPSG